MKGIIVEIVKNEAVILTEDGIFAKTKNRNYAVGQTVDTRANQSFETLAGRSFDSRKSIRIGTKWAAGAASIAAALAISTVGAFAYYTPTDYVSMDVNPSIEYTVNMFDRILNVNAVNEDGQEILADLDLKNKDLKAGMEETLDQLIEDGYLADGPDSGVVITTSNDEQAEAEKLAKDLKQEVSTYLETRKGIIASVDAEAVKPGKVDEAKDLGVTPGKLTLVEKLQESTTGAISIDEWLDKPVKEINKAIKENKKMEQAGHDDEDKQDVSDDNIPEQEDEDNSYPGKWHQDNPAENENQPYFTTGGGIVPDGMNGWDWENKDNNGGNGQNNGWGNGQGGGSIKDWFDNNNGNGGAWGPEWTTSGGIELPGYGTPSSSGSDSEDDEDSDKNSHSDDEDSSDGDD